MTFFMIILTSFNSYLINYPLKSCAIAKLLNLPFSKLSFDAPYSAKVNRSSARLILGQMHVWKKKHEKFTLLQNEKI